MSVIVANGKAEAVKPEKAEKPKAEPKKETKKTPAKGAK